MGWSLPAVGFLHESAGYQTREALVYDLQEPFRWLGDVATVEAFESGVVDMKDFYFTGDDYRYRIEVDAKRRFLELLKAKFNAGVRYKGKMWKWDTIILNKTQELARSLLGRFGQVDFIEPGATLPRSDIVDLRRRILELTQSESKELRIGKSNLHNLRKNAMDYRPFRVSRKTLRTIGEVSQTC